MKTHSKEAAESVLRELPCVVGAFVREDIHGHPREVHVLIGPGPNPRHLARDIRDLLREKLGIEVDQRIISIAQLTISADELAAELGGLGSTVEAGAAAGEASDERRLVLEAAESQSRDGVVIVRVRLANQERVVTGEATEIDVEAGRLRAAAAATLEAAAAAGDPGIRFQVEAASAVKAFGREYAVIAVLASSPLIGRKPLHLCAAQPTGDDAAQSAAAATLMAINRLLGRALNPAAR